MSRFRVAIVDTKFPSYERERAILEPLGAVVEHHRCRQPSDVLEVAADADVLMVTGVAIDAAVIAGLTHCRGIVRYGVGYDIVDVEAAAARGIPVVNVPDYCTEEVADHTMALILASLRKLPRVAQAVAEGRWSGSPERPIHSLRGRTLGLLGIGRIGRAVLERARPFGFVLKAHDPNLSIPEFDALGVARVSFDDLLAQSDVLSLHLPLTEGTRHVIDGRALARLQPGAFLINVSRGGLVDEAALFDALSSRRLGGAALDVFEVEPFDATSPLHAVDSLIATSHCAWYSEEARGRLQEYAALEAARLLRGEIPKHVVNAVR